MVSGTISWSGSFFLAKDAVISTERPYDEVKWKNGSVAACLNGSFSWNGVPAIEGVNAAGLITLIKYYWPC